MNTCPVGVATQDPELRKKFAGKPEHVVNFFHYVAEELRSIMASLGVRTVNEMVGRTDYLHVNDSLRNPKTVNLDLSPILTPAFKLRSDVATYNVKEQDHNLSNRLDYRFISESKLALDKKQPTLIHAIVTNLDRTIGTTLSYAISKRFGEAGLPMDTINIMLKGSAGQSLAAFLAPGISIELEGDANDYVGKGLSGGHLAVYPPKDSKFQPGLNVIVGNVCLYGATSGRAFFRGIAAERFAVRNSGAIAVVEGLGDHGCEYMTGGRVVVLGKTGRNFAAGMSGGIAYILDLNDEFRMKCNMELVELERINETEEIMWLRTLIEEHRARTGSRVADRCLRNWTRVLPKFVKVMPRDYKIALEKAKSPKVDILLPSKKATEPLLVDIEDGVIDEQMRLKKDEIIDKVRGFMKYQRQGDHYRDAGRRVKDWNEVNNRLKPKELKIQAARCMGIVCVYRRLRRAFLPIR